MCWSSPLSWTKMFAPQVRSFLEGSRRANYPKVMWRSLWKKVDHLNISADVDGQSYALLGSFVPYIGSHNHKTAKLFTHQPLRPTLVASWL